MADIPSYTAELLAELPSTPAPDADELRALAARHAAAEQYHSGLSADRAAALERLPEAEREYIHAVGDPDDDSEGERAAEIERLKATLARITPPAIDAADRGLTRQAGEWAARARPLSEQAGKTVAGRLDALAADVVATARLYVRGRHRHVEIVRLLKHSHGSDERVADAPGWTRPNDAAVALLDVLRKTIGLGAS